MLTTQISEPNSNTACTTALKSNPDTRGSAPYLLKILVVLFHADLSWKKFLNTAGQSFSAGEITRARYQKEFTISRGRP